MSGFVKVGNAAANLARTPGERAMVLYLYVEADRSRWQPFRASDRWLQEMSGMGSRQCRAFLDLLVSQGALQVTDAGSRHRPRSIRVLQPGTADKPCETHPNPPPTPDIGGSESPDAAEHHGTHPETHPNPPSPPDIGGSESLGGAQPGAIIPDSRLDPTTPTRPAGESGQLDIGLSRQAVTPAQQTLLRVLQRWTQPNAGAPHRWVVDWGDVLAWWTSKVLTRPEYAALDLAAQLDRWDNHLETAARQSGTRFPRNWKNAIHNWLGNASRYAAERGDHRKNTGPQNANRNGHAVRRRGQPRGESPGRFTLQPRDAGADG